MSDLVRGLQERVAAALPAEHVERLGDWWLRRSASSSWWLATVLPHGEATPDELARMIPVAEQFYAASGTTRFQITPGACPAGLDATLAARGYRRSGAMSLQTAATADVLAHTGPAGPGVRVADAPTDAWFEAWHAVHGDGGDPGVERDMLGRVAQPSGYASLVQDGDVVAVGRAVADTGWVGVFGMATLPRARGRGAAREILAALARWANAQQAAGLYLQVERANVAALRLYERAGFTELRHYHYRSRH